MTPRRQPSLPQSLPCSPRPFFPPSVAMLYEVFWGDALQLSLLCGWKRSSLPPPSLTALFLLGRRRADGAEEGGARPSLRLRCKFTPSPALSPSLPPIALGDIRAYVLRRLSATVKLISFLRTISNRRPDHAHRRGQGPVAYHQRVAHDRFKKPRTTGGARRERERGVLPPLPLSLSSSVADGPSHRADKRRVSATEKDGLCGRGRARTGGRERKGRADDARERKREGGTEPPREGEIEAPSLLPWHAEREREGEGAGE